MNNLRFISILILSHILYACDKMSNTNNNFDVEVHIQKKPCLERAVVKFNTYLFTNSEDSIENTFAKERLSTMTDNLDIIRLKERFSSLAEKYNMCSFLLCDSISFDNNKFIYYGKYSVERNYVRINGIATIIGSFTKTKDSSLKDKFIFDNISINSKNLLSLKLLESY